MRLIVFFMAALSWLPFDVAATTSLTQQTYQISQQLRDPASANQTLAESETQIAYELKGRIAQLLAEGKSQKEIETILVARYGEQILYRPTFSSATAALWLLPVAILIITFVALWRRQTKSRKESQ